MPQNNWYKGYCFNTHLHIKPYTHKRWWDATWVDGNLIRTIAKSDISLKDVRQQARLWIDKKIESTTPHNDKQN